MCNVMVHVAACMIHSYSSHDDVEYRRCSLSAFTRVAPAVGWFSYRPFAGKLCTCPQAAGLLEFVL